MCPLREIETLEANPALWLVAVQQAMACAEKTEREQGTAAQRILKDNKYGKHLRKVVDQVRALPPEDQRSQAIRQR